MLLDFDSFFYCAVAEGVVSHIFYVLYITFCFSSLNIQHPGLL